MAIDARLHRIVAGQPYPLCSPPSAARTFTGFHRLDSDFDLRDLRGAHALPLEKVFSLEGRG